MSPSPVRLSVIVPTHQTRELTLRCIETLVSEGTAGLQIVVVDDGSSDGTFEALEALAAGHPASSPPSHRIIEVLRLAQATGFTRAANLGLERARGEILLLLNSDTEVEPGAFSPLLAAFDRDPQLGAAGAALHYPDGSPQWSGGSAPTLLWLFGLASGLPPLLARLPGWRRVKPVGATAGRVDWVTGAALALRRQAWEEAGPLDEGFRFYGQDLDLCLKVRGAGWTIAVLKDFRVLHHHGATIRQDPGAWGRQHAELLWTDLLRWAQRHQGERWARRAALALRSGGALRLLGRTLASPLVPMEGRSAWRAESDALRRALRSVKTVSPE